MEISQEGQTPGLPEWLCSQSRWPYERELQERQLPVSMMALACHGKKIRLLSNSKWKPLKSCKQMSHFREYTGKELRVELKRKREYCNNWCIRCEGLNSETRRGVGGRRQIIEVMKNIDLLPPQSLVKVAHEGERKVQGNDIERRTWTQLKEKNKWIRKKQCEKKEKKMWQLKSKK